MDSPRHNLVIIDSAGDTLLILENPADTFAVWTEPVDAANDSEDISTEDNGEEVPCKCSDDESPHCTEWEETDGEHDEDERSKQRSKPPVPSVPVGWNEENQPASTAVDSSQQCTPTAIIYQVSSAHLMIASPRFMSEMKSLDSGRKDSNGFYHLKASNWDPDALEILLNTLHTRYRRVAKDLTLEMLAKVATIVNHYGCGEAFELISETWIRHARVRYPMPQTYDRDLILWMFVAWVFRFPKEFRKSTAITLRHCPEAKIQDMGLGIPPAVLRTLEIRRLEAIEQVIETCNCWIDEFSDTYTCRVGSHMSFECSSMLLGALMKQMRSIGVMEPQASAPFDGFSLEDVYKSIKALRSPIWETFDQVNELYPRKHACSFEETIIRDVEYGVARAKGLMLIDFVDCGENAEGLRVSC
ncbi:hypothetical protein ACJQWK_03253 [Exserohilum turcicum]